MGWIIVTMFGLSAFLFILSFAKKDPSKELEKQIENFSISLMQEIYQVKKKMKVMEEEFVIGAKEVSAESESSQELTRDDVLALYEEGYSVEDIAARTERSTNEIDELLANGAR